MIKFWSNPMSQPCRAVGYVLKKLAIEHEIIKTSLSRDTKSEDFKAKVNKRGKIPVIDVEGSKIIESSAIMQYLCDSNSNGEELLPKEDLIARSKVISMLDVSATTYRPVFSEANNKLMFKPVFYGGEKPTEEERKEVLGKVYSQFKDLNDILADQKFIAIDKFTIADVQIYNEVLNVCTVVELETKDYEFLNSWKEEIEKDPIITEIGNTFVSMFNKAKERSLKLNKM